VSPASGGKIEVWTTPILPENLIRHKPFLVECRSFALSPTALSCGSRKWRPMHADDHLLKASQKPQDGPWVPLATSPSQPTARPKPAVRAKRRFARWQTQIGRESYAGAKTDADVELAQRAYEARLAAGPDWMRYRGDSKLMDAPEVRITSKDFAAILSALDKIEQAACRSPDSVPRAVLTALKGGVLRRMLKYMLGLAIKFGRVYPSLTGLCKRAAFCAKATLVRVLDAAIELGFVTKHRRIETIDTEDGRKTCQANNAYEVHQPKEGSLGDKLLRSISVSSEFKNESAKGLESEISIDVGLKGPESGPKRTTSPEPRPAHRELPSWFTKFRALLST